MSFPSLSYFFYPHLFPLMFSLPQTLIVFVFFFYLCLSRGESASFKYGSFGTSQDPNAQDDCGHCVGIHALLDTLQYNEVLFVTSIFHALMP